MAYLALSEAGANGRILRLFASTESTKLLPSSFQPPHDKNLFFTLCKIAFLRRLLYFGHDVSSSVLQELILMRKFHGPFIGIHERFRGGPRHLLTCVKLRVDCDL